MSKTIDQKVVEMQFDNRQFERNVSTTLSSVEKLKKTLNFTNTSKGLEEVGASVKKIDMTGLGNAIETVRTKFSALEVMGVTALANITNSAVNAGKKIISALTIDPIKTGFQEYETQINAVQTILANTESKGTTLTQVNNALDELNKYADQTIYNFTEMTKNIGTFTAAGVDLDKSVTSIKGIANLAAVSGSNTQQASTAMYQLSQAIAAGKVQLMDWNSVVNAGMGGELFQNALKRTAENFGYNVDGMIKKYGSFRESLTKGGWLTAEVLTETLTQLSGAYTEADLIAQGFSESQAKEIVKLAETAVNAATKVKTFTQLWDTLKESAQSGWTQTWEILIGDFEEAKDFLTELSETFGAIIQSSADARNALLYDALTSNWKKITDQITEAGLSAEEFEEKITEVAKSKGLNIEEVVADYGSLQAAFKNGALSSDLLNEALIKMTGTSEDISKKLDTLRGKYKTNTDLIKALNAAGYKNADIQDLISKSTSGQTIALNDLSDAQLKSIGYTVDQISSIRELSEYSELAGGSLKELMDKVSVSGGRELLIDSLRVSIRSLIAIFEQVGKAWREVFPPMTSEELYNIIKAIQEFTLSLRPSEETLNKIQRTFRGFFAILDIGKQLIFAVIKAIGTLLGNFTGLRGGILEVTATIGDWIYNFDQLIKETDIFNTVFQGIAKGIQFVIDAIKAFVGFIKEKFAFPGFEAFHAFLERIHERMSMVGEAAGGMGSGVSSAMNAMGSSVANSKFYQFLQSLWDLIKKIGSGIANIFGSMIDSLVTKIENADFNKIIDTINAFATLGVGAGIMKFLQSTTDTIKSFKDITEGVVDIFDGIRGSLEAYQTQLKAGTLMKIASAIGILAASILVISLIDSDKLAASLGAITVLFGDLMVTMAIFSKISGTITGVTKSCTAMIAISVAVLILASALKKLSGMDFKELLIGVGGIAGLTAIIVASAKIMESNGKTIIKGATQMVIFAAAIKILASVCKDLSSLGWEELAKGLTGVGILLAEISLFLNTAKFSAKSILTAGGIVILSAAIKILASACKDFGQMDWQSIAKGLSSIGLLLAEITLFTRLTGNAKNVIATATALTVIGAAMLIFANATKSFASMQWEELARGLTGMAGALTAVTLALNFMPKNLVGTGTGLVLVSSALLILSNAFGKMGSMNWDQIARGLTVMGGSLAILAIGLNVMKGTMSGTLALMSAVTSLSMLAPVLSILGAMSWAGIAKGLIAIAGAFTVIGVAGAVLSPLVPVILSLSASFMLIGLSTLGIGAGLLAMGAGLSAIALGVTALAAAVAGGATAIAAGLVVIITGIASLIPVVIKKIGEGIIEFCKVIAEGAPAIAEAVKQIVLAILVVLTECIPDLVDGLLSLITQLLESLVRYAPRIIDAIMDFLILVLNGIAEKLPELVVAAVNLVMAFFAGVVDALGSIDVGTLLKGIAGVGLLAAIMAALGAVASLTPAAMVGVLGMAAVIAEMTLLLAAIGGLAQIPGLKWLIGEGGKLLESVGVAIGSFIGGIIGGVMGGISGQFAKIGTDLSNFMTNIQPFIEGAKSIDPSVLTGVKALAETILILTATSLVDSLTSWFTGGQSLTDFALELVPFGLAMKAFSLAISGMDADLVANAAIAGKTLAEMASTIPNSGGLISFFAGENDMVDFARQLIPFGQAMKDFSVVVSGMDADAVVNAATAGKALTELANTIPNTGGLVSFFTGDNDMAMFGRQLVSFGMAMKNFSVVVSGIDPETITNAAVAGKALIELANTIPNTGGLVSFFTGENDMAMFGAQLVSFGSDFRRYADYMRGVDPDVVTNTANAAKSLVELTKSLPENKLFKNETWLNEFGAQLSQFGYYFNAYYNYISPIDTVKLHSVIAEANNLVAMAKGMADLDTSVMSSFARDLTTLGRNGIDSFINAFSDATSRVQSAASSMLTSFIDAANSKSSELESTFSKIVTRILEIIDNKRPEFNSAGSDLVKSFISGVESNNIAAILSFTTILYKVVNEIRAKYSSFEDAGKYLIDGFARGIEANSWKATKKATELANKVAEATRKALDIHSPSGVYESIGNFTVTGFLNGISSKFSEVTSVGNLLGENVISGTTDSLGLNSSESVMENEIGHGIVDDISKGITEDTSAEEAASQKAQNIANAFQEELDKFDLDATTVDLEKQLWDAMYDFTASESEKSAAEMEALRAKILLQNEKVKLAQAEYNTTLSTLGSSSEDTQKAYNKLLQEQIDLADLATQYNTSQQTLVTQNQEAYRAYVEYLGENRDLLMQYGLTAEEAEKAARDATGYNPNLNSSTMNQGIEQAMSNAMESVKAAYQKSADSTFSSIVTQSTQTGASITEGIVAGVQNGTELATQNITTMIQSCVGTIKEQQSQWKDAGRYLVEGFAQGIEVNTYMAEAKAALMADLAYSAAMASLQAHSPSKRFMKAGEYVTSGFAKGIEDTSNDPRRAVEDMANATLDGTKQVISRLADAINGDIDAQPVIRPVLDLSDVESGASSLNALFSRTQASKINASIRAKETQGDGKDADSSQSGTVYQFTQNNYSPKALSRVEIYRQTKNLVSAKANASSERRVRK